MLYERGMKTSRLATSAPSFLLLLCAACGGAAPGSPPAGNAAAAQPASSGGAGASAQPASSGASSAQEVVERTLAGIRANTPDAVLPLLSPRLRAMRGEAESWNAWWGTWRTFACAVQTFSGVDGDNASAASADATANVTLRCADRERQSHLRLLREGRVWYWNEN